ncbi:hypothetical protein [Arenibacter sp. F20364]|uniref:hypothetical protein n=1 Tax=Arenibacter sp. F20364 TaxID=2926415 RepID=UPI001FF13C3A|nr:hypothetical protein [Arenibacter sp. F20364]MCK0190391.1 hypothetical protein [Arenibacter sp. F20364]
MTALIKVEQLISEENKNVITRNLSRILDLRILDIDTFNKTIALVYDNPFVLDKAKKELCRVGYSLQTPAHPLSSI